MALESKTAAVAVQTAVMALAEDWYKAARRFKIRLNEEMHKNGGIVPTHHVNCQPRVQGTVCSVVGYNTLCLDTSGSWPNWSVPVLESWSTGAMSRPVCAGGPEFHINITLRGACGVNAIIIHGDDDDKAETRRRDVAKEHHQSVRGILPSTLYELNLILFPHLDKYPNPNDPSFAILRPGGVFRYRRIDCTGRTLL